MVIFQNTLFQEITCSKSHLNKRLLGVSAKNVVLLENKTRSVLKKWDLQSLLGWKADESNGSLFLLFSESSFHFVCESRTERERLQGTIKQCVYQRNCEVSLQCTFACADPKGVWCFFFYFYSSRPKLRASAFLTFRYLYKIHFFFDLSSRLFLFDQLAFIFYYVSIPSQPCFPRYLHCNVYHRTSPDLFIP